MGVENYIKVEDLIEGEYYVLNHFDRPYVFIHYQKGNQYWLNMVSHYYSRFGSISTNSYLYKKKIRKATLLEIQWLKSCINADKFVEPPQIQEDYELY